MTNLQHVALFMFLIFLPMGRDVVLLLVSQCLALSTFNLSANGFAFMLTMAKLVKNQNLINLRFDDDESSLKTDV